jgi:enterochelin esterase family protein
MTDVTLTWTDPRPERPAHDVLVYLVALTPHAFESGDISPYLMRPDPSDTSRHTWTWTMDLPTDLRTAYQFCPARDRAVRGETVDDERWTALLAAGLADPSGVEDLAPGCIFGNGQAASVLSLPDAPAQPWVARRPDVPRGTVERLPLPDDSIVHLYRTNATGDRRTPLVVVFDGYRLAQTDVTATFDNLAADRVVEPLTVAIIESIRGSAPTGPSRIAGLTVATGLESFGFDDLLPAVAATCPVTADPARRVLVGHSLGALAALHLTTRRPDLFGAVVAGSPALGWSGRLGGLRGADVADAYLTRRPEGRLFLDVGSEEGDLLTAVRDFHGRLLSGEPHPPRPRLTYREFRGGHDHACWRGSLADGIVDILR